MHQMTRSRHPRQINDRMVFVNIETATDNGRQKRQKRCGHANWLAAALVLACLCASVHRIEGQSSPSPAQNSQAPQTPSTQDQNKDKDIPDAPSTAQPPVEKPEPPPIPRPEEKKPVERDPWTNQPINKPAADQPDAAPADSTSAPPPMPPIKTVPPGSSSRRARTGFQRAGSALHAGHSTELRADSGHREE